MTIEQMHIMFDVEVQGSDNNIRKRVIPETKDLYLNIAIEEIITQYLKRLTPPEESKGFDVFEYYAYLRSLFTQMTLYPVKFHSSSESKVTLPTQTEIEVGAGNLVCGIEYIVTCEGTSGNFNLTSISAEGYNQSGTNIKLGDRFTLTANAYASGLTPDIIWGGVKVKPVKGYDFLRYMFSRSNTTISCNLSNRAIVLTGAGTPIQGQEYVITKNYGTANFKGWGATCNDVGTVFTATNTSTPTEPIIFTGGQLTPTGMVHYVENFLQKTAEYYKLGEHAYGSTISRPYCFIMGNDLIIRHDNKFTINSVILDYVKKPVQVDYFQKIDCDLDLELHFEVVKKAVQRYLAVDMNPAYQPIAQENVVNDKIGFNNVKQ